MEEKISLDQLTKFGVSIIKKKIVLVDGKEYEVGEPNRCAYTNTASDRELLIQEIGDPYLTAILTVWGE